VWNSRPAITYRYKDYDRFARHQADKDKSFELLAEFDLDSIKVQIPGIIDMTLTE